MDVLARAVRPNEPSGFCGRKELLNPAGFGIGHNLSLTICPMTSEDINHQLIIIIGSPQKGIASQELCESRGGRPRLSVLTNLLVFVDVKTDEPCFGTGHNLSLICQLTSEDIKHQLIIIIGSPQKGIVQELCESRGGRPGLSVLTNLLVFVDVKTDFEPCFGTGHNLSLICQLTSEDTKQHFIHRPLKP